jgi:hypothetical protein
MRFAPTLARTTVSRIPPAHVFVVPPVGAGNFGLYLRVRDGAAARQLATHLKLGADVLAVQLAPFSTNRDWGVDIPGDLATSDVTDAVRLVYDPLPENLEFMTDEVAQTLRPGDLVVGSEGTRLVIAPLTIPYGTFFVDLATGEITVSVGEAPLRVQTWRLEGVVA